MDFLMKPLSSILARVRQHAGKPYLVNLSPAAMFALEYVLYQEQQRVKELAGRRYLTDTGKQKRVHGVQRTDIFNAALLAYAKRYHESEHVNDEDDEPCKICKELTASK